MRVVKLDKCNKSTLAGVLMAASLIISGCSGSDAGVSVASGAIGGTQDPSQGTDSLPGDNASDIDAPVLGESDDSTTDNGSVDSDSSGPSDDGQTPDNDGIDAGVPNADESGVDDSAANENGTGDIPNIDDSAQADDVADVNPNDPSGDSDDSTGSNENNQESNGDDVQVQAAFAGGADEGQRADDDESPTLTESLSLPGPFITDATRGAGPPSAPTGLTKLLAGENWIQFTWAPSTDDQSVEAYEIYRDGQLIDTVVFDSSYEFDIVNWQTTSYMDCNFTRFDCSAPNRQPLTGTSYSYSVAAVDGQGQRSERSAAVVMTTASTGGVSVDVSSLRQVFNEDFNDTVVDRSRWKTSLPWGPDDIINRETQYFVDTFGTNNAVTYDPFTFTGETLLITGIETPQDQLQAANNQPYLSGVLTTSDHFELTYGYVEMRAKLASGSGLLSTFYLFNQDFYKNKPEIDILEYQGELPDKALQTYHYHDSNLNRSGTGERHSSPTMQSSQGVNLSDDFHTYSVLWEPQRVIWFIDGAEVRRIEGVRVADEPMNIITQLVVGSQWVGAVDSSALPATLEIDYIKAWQQ